MPSQWKKLTAKYNYEVAARPVGIFALNDDHLKKRRNGILNIGIPKTASRWTSQVLKISHEHIQITPSPPNSRPEYETNPRWGWNQKLKIVVVRNPFDLLVSMWSHGFWHTCEWDIPNFKDWLKKFFKDWPNLQTKHFLFYQPFNLEGRCVADIAVKFEFLTDSFRHIINQPALRDVAPNMWKSKKRDGKDYQSFYDLEMRTMVEKHCSRELLWFDYSFRGNTSNFSIYDMKKAIYSYPWR